MPDWYHLVSGFISAFIMLLTTINDLLLLYHRLQIILLVAIGYSNFVHVISVVSVSQVLWLSEKIHHSVVPFSYKPHINRGFQDLFSRRTISINRRDRSSYSLNHHSHLLLCKINPSFLKLVNRKKKIKEANIVFVESLRCNIVIFRVFQYLFHNINI